MTLNCSSLTICMLYQTNGWRRRWRRLTAPNVTEYMLDSKTLATLCTFDSFLASPGKHWEYWVCCFASPFSKWPINQLKPVQQSRKQSLKAYCPNIYTLMLPMCFSHDLVCFCSKSVRGVIRYSRVAIGMTGSSRQLASSCTVGDGQ